MAQTDTFTNTGSWLCPAGVTAVYAQCWAGGAGTQNGTAGAGRVGGGGGAYAENTAYAVTPGNTYTVTVGIGGGIGANGGVSWFDTTSGVYADNGRLGSSGGLAANSIGTTVLSGGNGGAGGAGNGGGGGGEGADVSGAGGNGANAGVGTAAAGGTGSGGGDGGAGGNTVGPVAGGAGNILGGGAGGGATGLGAGNSGARGQVLITYTAAVGGVSLLQLLGVGA